MFKCSVRDISETYSLVRRGTSRHGALGTSVSRVRRVYNGDFLRARNIARAGDWVRRSEHGEEKSGELWVHFCQLSRTNVFFISSFGAELSVGQ